MGVAGVGEAPRVVVEALRGLGGEAYVDDEGRLVVSMPRRGLALADLPREALEAMRGFEVVVLVERGFGEAGTDYYYYFTRRWLERLLEAEGEGEG